MAQTGYTPILVYASGTATNVPLAINLTSSALGAELALNYADGKLYYKNSSGTVTLLASAAGSLGDVVGPASATDNALARFDSTTGKLIQNSVGILSDTGALSGLTDIAASGSITLSGGTANGVAYLNGSKVLTTGSALTFNGTNTVTLNASAANLTLGISTNYGLVTATGTNPASIYFNGGSRTSFESHLQYFGANHTFFNETGGSEIMRLLNTGNVGIGSTSPIAKLDISGISTSQNGLRLTATSGGQALAAFTTDTSTGEIRIGGTVAAAGNYFPVFYANGTEGMRLTSTSLYTASTINVGIGTSTPASFFSDADNLVVGTTSGNNGLSLLTSSTGTATLAFGYSTGTSAGNGSNRAKLWYDGTSDTLRMSNGGTLMNSAQFVLDSSGNLGIGTTTPASFGAICTRRGISVAGITGSVSGSFSDGANDTLSISHDSSLSRLTFAALTFNTGTTERARIDSSGNLLVGTTSSSGNAGFQVLPNGNATGSALFSVDHVTGSASGHLYASFNYNGSSIGSITQSGTTAVLYNVTSDQRLKENIVDAPEFGSVIDSLQVRSFDWKAEGSHQRAGFIAQELVTIAPEAVHQPTNEEEMMAVDYSKLVPMLVKEIQSLRQRLAAANL